MPAFIDRERHEKSSEGDRSVENLQQPGHPER